MKKRTNDVPEADRIEIFRISLVKMDKDTPTVYSSPWSWRLVNDNSEAVATGRRHEDLIDVWRDVVATFDLVGTPEHYLAARSADPTLCELATQARVGRWLDARYIE